MSEEISADQMEIIQEFIVESLDMLDNLEPTIIELGQSCENALCWETLKCTNSACPRFGQKIDAPCWLHTGYFEEGKGTCVQGKSAQDCLNCDILRLNNGDTQTMNAIFRLFHSMKGSAGFLDLTNISSVAHAAESLLDLIRSGKIRMQPSHVTLLCESTDFAREALDYVGTNFNDSDMAPAAEAITAKLKQSTDEARAIARAIHNEATPNEATPAVAEQPTPTQPKERAPGDLELLFTPEMVERFTQEGDELLQLAEQGLLAWPNAPDEQENMAALFRHIHSFKGNCGFLGYSHLEKLSHQMETILAIAKSGSNLPALTASETLLEMLDILRAGLADIADGGAGTIEGLDEHLQQLNDLIAAAEINPAVGSPTKVPPATPPLPAPTAIEQPVPAKVSPGKPTPPPAAPTPPPAKAVAKTGAPPAAKAAITRQDIRVDLEKLDQLINLIGEMVIAENMIIHNPDLDGLELENFHKAGQQMSKLVRELQEIAMKIRMVPVSGLFRRMIRLVHDLSLKAGKKVELILSGEDTEVDKTVIETITDPLVHLLRNSLDHGLEPPAERLAAGKPEKGVVRLSACHEEGEVWITIEDDGRGLNKEKILSKAISNGLIEGDGSDLSDKTIYNMIFQAGFSTADKITDVSGRGVGMDVVKQNIEKIKGKIEITSKPGKGSRMLLRIPLTLGIIDGMMVRVGDTKCIVPTLAIREAFRPVDEAITTTPDGQELARVRENFYPVIRLHEVLKKEPLSHELSEGILILLDYQDKGICLFVDEILGQQQTVIKGLSDYIGNVRWVSGCTILGDGEVCLILDVGHLVDMFDAKEHLGA